MPEFARMYREKHAAVVHAVATSYRDRSHFDGQDVLESGFAGPGRVQSGWLNRALEALPRGERVMSGLAVGPTTPLILRGARRRSAGRRSRCRRPMSIGCMHRISTMPPSSEGAMLSR